MENVLRSSLASRCPMPRVGVRADHTGLQNATRRAKERLLLGIEFRDKTQVYGKACNGFLGPGQLGGAAGE